MEIIIKMANQDQGNKKVLNLECDEFYKPNDADEPVKYAWIEFWE